MNYLCVILLFTIVLILITTKEKFNDLKKGDQVFYREDGIVVFDTIKCILDGNIITNNGKVFRFINFFRGDFQKIKN